MSARLGEVDIEPSPPGLLLRSTPLRVHVSVPLSRVEKGVSAVGLQADPHRLEP